MFVPQQSPTVKHSSVTTYLIVGLSVSLFVGIFFATYGLWHHKVDAFTVTIPTAQTQPRLAQTTN